MIVNELEDRELGTTIKEKFARSFMTYISNLPETVREYALYQLDTDPQGLFIKFFLLSVDAGQPNKNLEDLMHMWNVTDEQLGRYKQELTEEGFLDNEIEEVEKLVE